MRKKEEILLKNTEHTLNINSGSPLHNAQIKSMQEYADEQSVEFTEWMIDEDIEFVNKTAQHGSTYRYNDIVYTTNELLTIYKQENGII